MKKIKYSILSGFLFALIMFVYLAITSKMDVAIVVSIFIFLISPFIIYFKIFYSINYDDSFQKIDKSASIYSGVSSHFKDQMSVGGTLYLMSDRLIFQTNLINFIRRHELVLFLEQIEKVELTDTLDLFSNGLLIKNNDNQTEQFVVTKREIWKEQIEKQMSKEKTTHNIDNDN